MSAAEAPLGPPPAEPPISAGAALVGTFVHPVRTMERLAKRPTWWLPFVIGLVLTVASVYAAAPKIDVERSVRDAIEKRAARTGQTVSESVVQQQVAVQQKVAPFVPAIALVFGAGAFFVVGVVLWGAAQAFGGETRFGQALAVWSHAQLPNVVSAILAVPVFLTRPDASVTQQEASAVFKSSVGAFLPLDWPAAVRALASSLDVFTIWALVLLVVGFRRLPGMTKATGAAAPIVCFAIYVLIKTLWMAVFG